MPTPEEEWKGEPRTSQAQKEAFSSSSATATRNCLLSQRPRALPLEEQALQPVYSTTTMNGRRSWPQEALVELDGSAVRNLR